MNVAEWVGENLEYARDLVSSAVEGAKDARHALGEEQKLPEVLVKAAPSTVALTALGIGAGIVCSYFGNKRKFTRECAAFGLIGGVAGLLIGLGWSTRHVTNGLANGAVKGMNHARDERWLERHPIDYA